MEPDLTATLTLLAAFPAALDALLRPLPDHLTQVSEAPDSWTLAQMMAHLVHAERTDWVPRVEIILRAGESETFPAFKREGYSNQRQSVPALLTEFAELRAASLARIQELHLTPEDLELGGRHPVFGRVTLSQLLATWAAHDLTHLHQASRILASQFREAVGPWNRYLGVLRCDGHSEKA